MSGSLDGRQSSKRVELHASKRQNKGQLHVVRAKDALDQNAQDSACTTAIPAPQALTSVESGAIRNDDSAPWWVRLLARFDITYEEVEVAPSQAKKRVLGVLAAEREKLMLKMQRLDEQLENQLTDWAVNDERNALGVASYFDGAEVSEEASAESINVGSFGVRNSAAGRSIARSQRRQR